MYYNGPETCPSCAALTPGSCWRHTTPVKIFEAHGPLATEGGCMITIICKDANGKLLWTWYPTGEDGEEAPTPVPPGGHLDIFGPFVGSAMSYVEMGVV